MNSGKFENSEALETFLAQQSVLIEQIVNGLADKAVRGAWRDTSADTDERRFCRGIGYDDIEAASEPLARLGVTISTERLMDFLEMHPSIEYTDIFNIGVTVYVNEQAMTDMKAAREQKQAETPTMGMA